MGRRSNIEFLDPRIKQEIDKLLSSGRYTLDDVLERLEELGEEGVSRSGLHRYAKNFDLVVRETKQLHEFGTALASEMGAAEETDMHKALSKMIQGMMFRYGMTAVKDKDGPGASELAKLARAQRDIMATSAQREKLRKEIEADANRKAVDSMEKVATEAGLSADRVAQIRRDFLGIREDG